MKTATLRLRALPLLATAAAVLATATAGPAAADLPGLGITEFSIAPTTSPAGTVAAGAHDDVTVTFAVASRPEDPANYMGPYPAELAKNLTAELPAGLLADPTSVPTCTEAQLEYRGGVCPDDTQVGLLALYSTTYYDPDPAAYRYYYPVFNMGRRSDQVVRLGFPAVLGASAVAHVDVRIREDGDYGATAVLEDLPSGISFYRAEMQLWGDPSAPAHDTQRSSCQGDPYTSTQQYASGRFLAGCTASVPDTDAPFMINPTRCGAPLHGTGVAEFYERPAELSTLASSPFTVSGCETLPFAPALAVTPDTNAAAQPAGYAIDLSVPQTEKAGRPATAHVRDVTVTLPPGVAISPAAANGLRACSDAQLGLGTRGPSRCPDAAKVGTVEIESPLLDAPLQGAAYVGTQESDDPRSGRMFRLLLSASGQGVDVKLAGGVQADPATGQPTATFADNPQLPFSALHVRLFGGPQAVLANPSSCGEKAAAGSATAWSGAAAPLAGTFAIDCGTVQTAFTPSFAAGTAQAVAGGSSPFTLTIAKPDGQPDLTGVQVVLPAGVLADLRGREGTQVGTVRALSGTGGRPLALPGRVFFEGRHGDAPFSLRVEVDAKAGPFDLGTVVVRQKLYVDPLDAHVTVVSDPLPTIVKGVPIALSRLDVALDAPGFMVNPTSCAAQQVAGTLTSAAGQSSTGASRYRTTGCERLALRPSLALELSGKGETRDGDHPALTAVLRQGAGQANLRKARVALPLSLALDPGNAASDGLCSFAEGSKPLPRCPQSSVVGTATVRTPILDEPLTGPVYFVKDERKDPKTGRSIRTLPKLVLPLTGENGVALTLTATSSVVGDRLVATFDGLPDAPVSEFRMRLDGGKKGILVVTGGRGTDLCRATQQADQRIDGQNGRHADARLTIATPSCPLRILAKRVRPRSVVLTVGGIRPGKVTVRGRGIRTASRTIVRSTVATIVAKRTGREAPRGLAVRLTPTLAG